MIRDIVSIDEEKCDGCGLCVPACHEGAIRIINGKARLAADNLCDGIGDCLGHCPQGAIRIEKRDAVEYDEAAVAAHLRASSAVATAKPLTVSAAVASGPAVAGGPKVAHAGCPSQRFARLGHVQNSGDRPSAPTDAPVAVHRRYDPSGASVSALNQWPVQLRLLPPRVPVFQNANLLLAADCAPFAMPDFHRILEGHALAIACPKLDDTSSYVPKLTEIISANQLRGITVVHMEVPCCTGILMMAMQARQAACVDLPIEEIIVSVRGEVLARRKVA